jgi:integrase
VRTPERKVNPQTGEVYFRVRYRKDGRERAHTFYGDTEALARADADDFIGLLASLGAERAVKWWNDHLDDEPGNRGLTLDQWWARYLAATTGITDGTRITYDRTYQRVWAGPLGGTPLTAITREDIAAVVNQLSAAKSDKTVRNAYGILATCLKVALEDGHIPALPTRGIRLPRRTEHTQTEIRFLDHDEWGRLAAALPAHYLPLFTFLVGTGCRWGEAEALTVGDVNLDRVATHQDGTIESTPVVTISKAAKWNASKATRQVGPTKTRRSNRTVYLPPEVVELLEPLVRGRSAKDRLFLAPKGGPLRHRTVYDDWKKAVAKSGLTPHPRIHDLRHTHVSWLIAQGVPLVVIQRRLGHEDITTTMNVYGHLAVETELAAAQAASIAMQPSAMRALKAPAPK